MSSSAVSCCMCFPKASSAFATLASSPTDGGLLSCPCAFKYSVPFHHRRPNQKPPLPRNHPTLALFQMWRPHGGHRETYGCPDPTPFSAHSRRSRRMIRPFRSPLPGASHHLPPSCALLAPKPAPHFKPHLEFSPQPHANYHHTNPPLPVVNFSPSSPSLSHHPNTIQFA